MKEDRKRSISHTGEMLLRAPLLTLDLKTQQIVAPKARDPPIIAFSTFSLGPSGKLELRQLQVAE